MMPFIAVLLGGLAVFTLARFSRQRHEKSYGKASASRKSAFGLLVVGMTALMMGLFVLYPGIPLVLGVCVYLLFYCGFTPERPGIYKDLSFSLILALAISFPLWLLFKQSVLIN
ncbi:hypothetical protein ACKC9G_14635 [Pokkaliibacter sp. CJK22405]|uniref:hypothetical protein n=1 Tax=Pokkaliibacter sp. CJK22405 TaxID=3384615 RepID=UPI003984BF76